MIRYGEMRGEKRKEKRVGVWEKEEVKVEEEAKEQEEKGKRKKGGG